MRRSGTAVSLPRLPKSGMSCSFELAASIGEETNSWSAVWVLRLARGGVSIGWPRDQGRGDAIDFERKRSLRQVGMTRSLDREGGVRKKVSAGTLDVNRSSALGRVAWGYPRLKGWEQLQCAVLPERREELGFLAVFDWEKGSSLGKPSSAAWSSGSEKLGIFAKYV